MSGDTVHLTVPATSAFAAVARATAASVAVRAGATIDDVEDVRVAVSEAFALLLADLPDGEQQAHVDLSLTAGSVEFRVSAPAAGDLQVDRDSFAWTILDALVEDAVFALDSDATGQRQAVITGACRLHVPA